MKIGRVCEIELGSRSSKCIPGFLRKSDKQFLEPMKKVSLIELRENGKLEGESLLEASNEMNFLLPSPSTC